MLMLCWRHRLQPHPQKHFSLPLPQAKAKLMPLASSEKVMTASLYGCDHRLRHGLSAASFLCAD